MQLKFRGHVFGLDALFFEYIYGEPLCEWVQANKNKTQYSEWWSEIKKQLHSIAEVLSGKAIMHGDINQQNILISSTTTATTKIVPTTTMTTNSSNINAISKTMTTTTTTTTTPFVKLIDFSDAHLSPDAAEYTEYVINRLIEQAERFPSTS
jgi:serine/threonine protein kinase